MSINGLTDMLELLPSGVYRHSYNGKDGKPVVETEKWELETIEGAPTVDLHNFRSNVSAINAPGRGYYLLRLTSSWGRYRLWVDPGANIYYERK